MNIAIFNSFTFHYEVFGFFIYYCFINKYNLTIFTTLKDNYGWIDFYYLYFKERDYFYKVYDYQELSHELLYLMDKVIVTTDDDSKVPKRLVSQNPKKFIFIGHDKKRMKDNYIPIFPFDGLAKFDNYVMPVFPIDIIRQNIQIKSFKFKILLVGDAYNLKKIIANAHIEYLWVHRKNQNHNQIKEYIKSHTFRLINLLKQSDFVLYPDDHSHGKTMSGLLPLAISTCTPIIFKNDKIPKIIGLKNYILHEGDDSTLIEKMKKFKYDNDQYKEVRAKIIRQNIKNLNIYIQNIQKIQNISLFSYEGLIHFIWIGEDSSEVIPERYLSNVQTFKNMNPKAKIMIWNNENILKLLNDKRYLEYYKNLPKHIYKSDFSRFLIIYLFGGLYCDLDFLCVYNLYDMLHDKDVALFFEPNEQTKLPYLINIGVLYSKNKNNEIFLTIVEDMIHNNNNAVYSTGQIILSKLYDRGLIPKEIIYDSHYIIPFLREKKFSKEKLLNMDKISFVYTLTKEGHWDLDKEKQFGLDKKLEYYITHPDEYFDTTTINKSSKKKYIIIVFIVLLFIFLSIIIYWIIIMNIQVKKK